jgi:type I restriction enzyme S subunit
MNKSIPESWVNCKFGDLVEIKNGYAFRSSEFKKYKELESDIPLVRQSQLRGAIVDLSDAVYLDHSYLLEFSNYVITKGDIIIGMSGSIGKVCEYLNDAPALQNQRTGKLKPLLSGDLDPKFFGLFLSNVERMLSEYAKGMGVQNISAKDIENLGFNLPPFQEQHRIVAKIETLFSELDKGIESFKTAREQLKIYRQSLLKHAFSGKLTEQWRAENPDKLENAQALLQRIETERQQRYQQQLKDWEANDKQGSKPKALKTLPPLTTEELAALPELPNGWIYIRAEEISDFITKGTTPSKELLFEGNGEIPFIKVYNLTKTGFLDFSIDPTFVSRKTHNGFLARSKVYPGDVLMNIVGPPLGKVSIVPDSYPEWNINQAISIFRTNLISSRFLATYLAHEDTVRVMMKKSKATAGQFNLTLEICRETLIPFCGKNEQAEIENLIDAKTFGIDQLDQTITTALQQAEALRQSILKKAFSGQLVPQDPSDEPASVLLERIRLEKAALSVKPKSIKPKRCSL